MNSAIARYLNVRPSCTMLPSLLHGSRARSLSTFSRNRFFGSSLLAGVGSLIAYSPYQAARSVGHSILDRRGFNDRLELTYHFSFLTGESSCPAPPRSSPRSVPRAAIQPCYIG